MPGSRSEVQCRGISTAAEHIKAGVKRRKKGRKEVEEGEGGGGGNRRFAGEDRCIASSLLLTSIAIWGFSKLRARSKEEFPFHAEARQRALRKENDVFHGMTEKP